MKGSLRPTHRSSNHSKKSLLAVFVVTALLVGPLSTAQGEALRDLTRNFTFRLVSIGRGASAAALAVPNTADRAAAVTHFRLCPRHLALYEGEAYTLVPLPIDSRKKAVDGVSIRWETSDTNVATVSSWGEVSAIAPGHAIVTAQAGTGRATVSVEVRAGGRPRQTDLEFNIEHAGDCDDPVSSSIDRPSDRLADNEDNSAQEGTRLAAYSGQSAVKEANMLRVPAAHNVSKELAQPAALRVSGSQTRRSTYANLKAPISHATSATKKIFSRGFFWITDPIDGSSDDTYSPAALSPHNALGRPRFGAQESSQGSATKTKNLLGSYDFSFVASVLSLGGRGIGTDLSLVYNSRLWEKDTNGMTFNYNKGWPAAGWSFGYGRIIQNYDNTAAGDQSSVGYANPPGNYLLLLPDGTRIHLQQSYDPAGGAWNHNSTDGTFITLNPRNGKLRYPDGTLVKYDSLDNNRLLPKSIRTRNGDLVTIAYKTFLKNQPNPVDNFLYRWAINTITDSLGRIITFHYYGEKDLNGQPVTEYAADSVNGKPDDALAGITITDFGGSGVRTLAKFYYQNITLQYSFSSAVDSNANPASGSTLTVLKRIYYPATGTGYLFPDYSSYGMIKYISVRNNMTGAGAAVTDGSEIAYTKYNYLDTGTLSDAPQFNQRSEWWQGKTDDSGNATTLSSVYSYSRSVDDVALTETNSVTYPNNLQVVTVSNNDPSSFSYGKVSSSIYKDGAGTTLRQMDYTYLTGAGGGIQLASVVTTDDAGQKAKVSYDYGSWGRLANVYEYGFKASSYTVKRRTLYQYSDDAGEIGVNLLRLLTEVDVYDALADNDNTNDVLKAKTVYSYDNYAVEGGMEYYGLNSSNYPPNHDSTFDQNNTTRGNVTGVQTFSSISPSVSTTRHTKWDIFGNIVQADVSCCQVKNVSFSSTNYYSQPMSETSGTPNVAPYLTTSYQYDFSTGLINSATDPRVS
jgi:hypothetical protein